MPTGQIAGEVDVTCNYRRRQWGVLLLATTTQICAEGLRPEALVHLVVELQAQVVPEPVVGGRAIASCRARSAACERSFSLSLTRYSSARRRIVWRSSFVARSAARRATCCSTVQRKSSNWERRAQPVRRARRIIAAVPEGEADVTNAPPLAPRRTSS